MPPNPPHPKRQGTQARVAKPTASPSDRRSTQNTVVYHDEMVKRARQDPMMRSLASDIFIANNSNNNNRQVDTIIRDTINKGKDEVERLKRMNRDEKNKRIATQKTQPNLPQHDLDNLVKNLLQFRAKFKFYAYVLDFMTSWPYPPLTGFFDDI